MRHGDKVNNLGRTASHRKALLKNLSCSLIQHKRINTTLAKAKALRKHIEPILTKSKDNTTHSRRVIFSYLQDKESIKELFATIAPKIADRPGGYLRIIRTGFRRGDGAETALIELVDFNETYTTAKTGAAGKKKRTRRGPAKTTLATPAAKPAKAEEVTEEAVEEVVAESVAEVEVEPTPEVVVEQTPEESVQEETPEVVAEVVAEETEVEVPVAEAEVEAVAEASEETPAAETTEEEHKEDSTEA